MQIFNEALQVRERKEAINLNLKHRNISQGDVMQELKHHFRYLVQSSSREQASGEKGKILF